MAAPLPQGYNLQVMPQAPQVDPTLFAPDALKQLQVAHSGMLLGKQLADLENQRAERELTKAKIEADKKANELQLKYIEHAKVNLPVKMQAELEASQLAIEKARMEKAGVLASMQFGLPEKTAELGSLDAVNRRNALIASGAYYKLSPAEQKNLDAQAAAYGAAGMGLPGAPAPSRELEGASAPGLKLGLLDQPKFVDPSAAGAPARSLEGVRVGSMTDASPGAGGLLGFRERIAKSVERPAADEAAEQTKARDYISKWSMSSKDLPKEAFTRSPLTGQQIFNYEWFTEEDSKRTAAAVVTGKLIEAPAYQELMNSFRALNTISGASAELDKLGDPSVTQRFLDALPDPNKENRSLFEKFRSTWAATKVSPETAQRSALLSVLNTMYQGELNSVKEGRELRNFKPLDVNQANDAIKKVIEIVEPKIREKYEGMVKPYDKRVRESIEGARSVGSVARSPAAPSAPAKDIPDKFVAAQHGVPLYKDGAWWTLGVDPATGKPAMIEIVAPPAPAVKKAPIIKVD